MLMQFREWSHGILQEFDDGKIEMLRVDRHLRGDNGDAQQGSAAIMPCPGLRHPTLILTVRALCAIDGERASSLSCQEPC